jgi:TatD DNase family protein
MLLCETDTPDQAPHPHRGTLNQPAHLVHVVHALAAARGEAPDETAAHCTRNARTLLKLA